MPKYIQLARSYFNDKDIQDLLGNPRFSQRLLLQVARDRGIYLSANEKRETIIGYLSLHYFDWQARNALTARLDRDDPDERRATVCIDKVASIDAIEKATEAAKSALEKDRQVIQVKKLDGRLVINGTYIDIDPTASKGVQRQQKNFSAEFEVEKGMIKVEYTHSAKAANLISGILEQLKGEESTKDVTLRRISLTGIKDPVARTNFLLSIRTGMKGFRALDVLDINVDHRFEEDLKPEDESEDGEEKSEETTEQAEVKSMVRTAVLRGNGLLTSDLYQRLREKNYYIYKLVWSGKELGGEGHVMEFEVGFDNPVQAEGFCYDVKRVLPSDAEKEAGKTQHELLMANRPRVRRLVAESAYKALDELEKSAIERKSKK